MKISDVIFDKKSENRKEKIIKISDNSQIKINLENLTRLIREIINLKDNKVSAIQKTKGIEKNKALEIFINLLNYSPSPKEQSLTHKESLADFLSKHVIIKWKGIKHRKIKNSKQKQRIFYKLLMSQPQTFEIILNIGLKEYENNLEIGNSNNSPLSF